MAKQLWGFDSEAAFARAREAIHRSERDVGTNRVPQGHRVQPNQWQCMVGKCDADVSQGALGTVSIYSGTSVTTSADLTDTTDNVSALFLLGDGTSGDWVVLFPVSFGYIAVNAECPA